MWFIPAVIILGLIGYAVFSKNQIKPRKVSDLTREDPYTRANDPLPRHDDTVT